MKPLRRTSSLVAERAVRFVRSHDEPVSSLDLVREVLSTTVGDESTATTVLVAAFAGDPRLVYGEGGWGCVETEPLPAGSRREPGSEPDRTLILMDGGRLEPRGPFEIRSLAAIRIRGYDPIDACGGEPGPGRLGETLRRSVLSALDGAVPVVHDPPGAVAALESWLEEPLDAPISVRRLAADRLKIRVNHDLGSLAGILGLQWRDTSDLVDLAETLDEALRMLMREGESLSDVREALSAQPRLPWERYAFDRAFLRALPSTAGTYRFLNSDGSPLYVGKSKNLKRRISSYFTGKRKRSRKQRAMLEAVHRIEFEPLQSDLEAVLQEAIAIRRDEPVHNVQREVHPRVGRPRIQSIVILEPAVPPLVLRAYLIRDGRLIDKVGIGPRGGGLRRIERLLEDYFFAVPWGPTAVPGPDLDVELITRWLAQNRDRAVAFDPTNLPGPRDVSERIRCFLTAETLLDPDGSPTLIR
jgi:hypothetical protein